MCRYCKHLRELRNEDRKIFDDVLDHYKRLLYKDEKLFRRCLLFIDNVYFNCELAPHMTDEYGELSNILERLLEGGVLNEKNKSTT